MSRALKAVLTLAALAAALYLLDWRGLSGALSRLDAGTLLVALALSAAQYGPVAWRWALLAGGLSSRPARLLVRDHLLSGLYNMLTPANLGGDASRVLALRAEAGGALPAALAVAAERVLGLAGYLAAFLGAFALAMLEGAPPAPLFRWAALGCGLGLAGLWAALRFAPALGGLLPSRLGGLAALFDAAARVFASMAARLPALAALTLAAIALWALALRVVASGLGFTPGWGELGMVATLVELIRFVPLTVQGIGVREAAYASLLALCGHSPEQGFLLGAVGYLVLAASLVLTGGIGAALPARGAAPGE